LDNNRVVLARIISISILLTFLTHGVIVAADARVIHAEHTRYGHVYVIDRGDTRILRLETLDGDDQSIVSLTNPETVPMDYVRYATIALAYIDSPSRMLMVGLGGGTYTTLLWKHFPKLSIEAVEINPAVIRLAREYFGVPNDPRYQIHINDGAVYLQKSKQNFDLIFIDAYTGQDGIPAHLSTKNFFYLVQSHLSVHGVAIINIAAQPSIEKRIVRRFQATFPANACFRTPGDNLLVVGLRSGKMPSQTTLVQRATQISLDRKLPFDLGKIATRLGPCQ
jgi:spermidine synthase